MRKTRHGLTRQMHSDGKKRRFALLFVAGDALSGGKLVINISGALALGIVLGRLARFLLRVWKNTSPSLTVNFRSVS